MIKQQSTGVLKPVATSGEKAHASTTGFGSSASTAGDWAHASTAGTLANAMTAGYWSKSSTTGDDSHATTSGNGSHASTQGRNSIAAALGMNSRAKAGDGGWIVLASYSEDGALLHVRTGQVGKDVKPNVWYSLSREGRFIEHQDQEAQQGGQPS